ncbi:adenylate kinase [Candidatus Woesearchaeota archaeon]|nr:adenylate kinase [Candidatus Woesearchaeota archaeon]
MRIVLLGAPGVGKGTVAALLSQKYGLPHISTGDIFKEEIRKASPMGLRVKAIVESGALVPDSVVNDLMKDRLSRTDVRSGFILDGYPRTVEQAKAMDSFATPELALNFSASRRTIIERLSGRRVCPKCGAIYHVSNNPPKKKGICNGCNEKLITRKDDEPAVISNRLDVYDRVTRPLIDYYRSRGLLAEINSDCPIGKIDRIIEQCVKALSRVGNNG